MGEKSCNLKRQANIKRNKPSRMTYDDCTFFNHPIFPTVKHHKNEQVIHFPDVFPCFCIFFIKFFQQGVKG